LYTSQSLTIYETVVKNDRIWRYIISAKLIAINKNWKLASPVFLK
jgi:hypothetical protein